MNGEAYSDLKHAVRLLRRERYQNDEAYRLQRCTYSSEYYLRRRMTAGETVKKTKYEAPISNATPPEENNDS